MRPALTINRRHLRTNQLMHMVLHHLRPILDSHPDPDAYRNAARKLEELFHTAGAYIVTDADRAAAGLPMRDHNGLTLEELVVIEAKMMQAMMETLPSRRILYEVDGKPVVEKVKP